MPIRESHHFESLKEKISSHGVRHLYYIFGFYFFHGIAYFVILSMLAFFHFLLNHRLADIQDWIFFHSWWILIFSKAISFFLISRFTGILSYERNPLLSLFEYRRGVTAIEVFISITVIFLGLLLLGRPQMVPYFEWDFLKILGSYLGNSLLFLFDALVVLILNISLPLSKKSWFKEIFFLSFLCFFLNRWIYFYGENWKGFIFFFYLLTFYALKLKGEFVWFHSFLIVTFLIAPLASLFGLDPLWKDLFSPFKFTSPIGGLEIGVFCLLSLLYFQTKRFRKISFLGHR